jgi:hypothetical protein
MDKKGSEVSITFIVIAIISIIVLIVVVMFFTGAFTKLMKQESDISSIAGKQEQEIYKSLCKSYCTLGSSGYCDHVFEYRYEDSDNKDAYTCYKCSSNSDPTGNDRCNGAFLSLDVDCGNKDVKC